MNNSINSDHILLRLELYSKGITETKHTPPKRKKNKQKIIAHQNATAEQWTKFTEKIEEKINESNLLNITYDTLQKVKTNQLTNNISSTLNNIWQEFSNCLISTAFLTLPTRRIRLNNNQTEKEKVYSREFHLYQKALYINKPSTQQNAPKKIKTFYTYPN